MRLILLIILSLNLTACYQNKKLRDNTLVYCTEDIPTFLNPQLSHDITSLDATTHQLFNRLVKLNQNNNKFIPDLAESWQLSKDKLTYRFKLRKQISFHQTNYFRPTRYVNADDVIFSFQRLLSNEHPFHTINGQANSYFFKHPFTPFLTDIKKVDQHTIDFVLSKPDVRLLANLAAHYAVIHSQEYAQELLTSGRPEDFDTNPIGTGPFQLSSFDESVIRYKRNPLYWQSSTAFDHLIFVKNSNATKRYTKLLSKECDVISYPAASQLHYISQNPEITLNSELTSDIAFWAFNTRQPQLKHAAVRQALSLAINKDIILDAVYFHSATPTDTLLSNQSWAKRSRTPEHRYDPDLAKQMLKEQGFDFNDPIGILVPENSNLFNPNFHKTAELIQSNLKDAEIDSEIISLNQLELKARLKSGDYDTLLTGMNVHINDPDSVLRPLLSCGSSPENGNSSGWCSKQTEQLLNEASLESNFFKRIKNYYLLQAQVYEQRPYLPLAHTIRLDAISASIDNVFVNPLTGINFQHAVKKELD